MADLSIAAELLSCVSLFRYQSVIPCLTMDDFMPLQTFQRSELGKLYDMNRTGCHPNGIINNSHLFELFGNYSDEDAESVRSDTLECINTSERVYSCVGIVFFTMREWSFKEWALTACSSCYYGDELLLYALCRIFHRHATVVCRDRNWSTLEPEGTMTTEELMSACDLHLVYLRPSIFGELVPKKSRIKKCVSVEMSPPEFLAWSAENTTIIVQGVPDLEGFVDTELLPTYLNIHDSLSEETQGDNDDALSGGNNNTVPLTGGNAVDVQTKIDSVLTGGNENTINTPLMGGNNTCDQLASDDTPHLNNDNDVSLGYSDQDIVLEPTVEFINPTSLLKNCIQKLQEQVLVEKPMSLAHCCIDFMSWNWDRRFGINMLLPNIMSTIHSVAEICRVCAPVHNRLPVGLINFGNNVIE